MAAPPLAIPVALCDERPPQPAAVSAGLSKTPAGSGGRRGSKQQLLACDADVDAEDAVTVSLAIAWNSLKPGPSTPFGTLLQAES